MCRARRGQIPYFRDCGTDFILQIYSRLTHMVYAPHEKLNMPSTLYLIVNGGIVAKAGAAVAVAQGA